MTRFRDNAVVCLFAVSVAALVAALGWAIVSLPTESDGLALQVDEQLVRSGAKNPVTAVLLNFRGYDTMLEVTVLLLAALGARAIIIRPRHIWQIDSSESPVLTGFLRLVAPVIVVVAGYLLWVGGDAPGGAFQSGAVLAALGVLLLLGGVDWTVLLTVGLAAFIAIGEASIAVGSRLLEFPPELAKWSILLIEVACTVSIAAVLVALLLGGTFTTEPDDNRLSEERVP
jgi:multisubunit Na+/H+ antiporter MnhB subunit